MKYGVKSKTYSRYIQEFGSYGEARVFALKQQQVWNNATMQIYEIDGRQEDRLVEHFSPTKGTNYNKTTTMKTKQEQKEDAEKEYWAIVTPVLEAFEVRIKEINAQDEQVEQEDDTVIVNGKRYRLEKFERGAVGKNVHAVYVYCNSCYSWGVNLPLEKECGNCGNTEDAFTYYDAETITLLINQAVAEERARVGKIIEESRWECPEHGLPKFEITDCVECDSALEINVVLEALLASLDKTITS